MWLRAAQAKGGGRVRDAGAGRRDDEVGRNSTKVGENICGRL